MHRHGYSGRKLGREIDQRRALIKSLAESLIIHETIETTLPKAKELVPYVERLITKAKSAKLNDRRNILRELQTVSSTHKLIDEIVPKLKARNSGHLRIERTKLRRGDLAQLARVSFVDDLKAAPVAKPTDSPKTKPVTKKPVKQAASATKSGVKT